MTTTAVAMKRSDGTSDSKIHLPDASTLIPAVDGTVMVPALFVNSMINAGYQIVVSSGTTHIP